MDRVKSIWKGAAARPRRGPTRGAVLLGSPPKPLGDARCCANSRQRAKTLGDARPEEFCHDCPLETHASGGRMRTLDGIRKLKLARALLVELSGRTPAGLRIAPRR